jgi:hypothetical protein
MDVMERNAFALTRGGEAVTTRVMAHQSVYDPNNRKKTRAVLQGTRSRRTTTDTIASFCKGIAVHVPRECRRDPL